MSVRRRKPPTQLSPPGTKSGRLQRLALEALQRHKAAGELPTPGRFIYYELEQLGDVSKKATGRRRADQDLTDAIKRLRDVGIIPWDWVEDDTRVLHEWRSAASVRDYVLESVDFARIDPWIDTLRPVVLCEARTVANVLVRALGAKYSVPIAATNGMCSGFLITKIVPLLRERPSRVLCLVDLDLSGADIESHTRRVLEQHLGGTFDDDTWQRLAITPDQADELRRRGVRPIPKTDGRFKNGQAHEAFECEALGQSEVIALVEEQLRRLLPEPLDVLERREERQRREVRRLLARGGRR